MLKNLALLFCVSLISACGGGSDASFDNGNVRLLQAIEVSPADSSLPVGLLQSYTATGLFTDGSREDISSSVSWSVVDDSVATIDQSGVASALAIGETTVTAAQENVSGEAQLSVTDAVANSLQVLPPTAELPINATQDYRAFAIYSDGRVENVTFNAEWTLENESGVVEPFDPDEVDTRGLFDDFGTAIARAAGEDIVVARFAGLESRSDITVRNADLLSISVTPADEITAPGNLIAYKATGNYSDGSTTNLSKVATWSSSDPSVATISNSGNTRGLANALAEGETRITASFEGLSDATGLTVLSDEIVRLDVLPAKAAVDVGETLQYQAIAITEQGRSVDVTSGATWTSVDVAIASVDNRGLASGVAPGNTTIGANYQGIDGSGQLEVRSPAIALVAITIEPANAALFSFTTLEFSATGIYSDGSNADITDRATWRTEDSSILVVSNDNDFGRGLAFGLVPGETRVSAELDGIVGSTRVTVVPTQDEPKLRVNPSFAQLPEGSSTRYSAELVINGERAIDVSEFVAWSSSLPEVASVDASGLVRALAQGSTAIQAQLNIQGVVLEDSGQLDVRPAPPQITELIVEPVLASVIEGGQQQFSARLVYSDGSSVIVTEDAQWRSADSAIATVDLNGLATGINAGETRVIALVIRNGVDVTGSAALQVLAPSVTGLSVTPASASTLPAGNVQFTAIAEFENGTTEDVSDSVSWLSSSPAIAQVDSRGLATGIAPGAADIEATLATASEPISDSGRLQVTAPVITIDQLIVEPAVADVLVGNKQPFSARVVLSDGSQQDVSDRVSWISADTNIASVNGQGRAIGISEGVTAITASLNFEGESFTDSATITVIPLAITIEELIVDPARASVLTGGTQAFTARVVLSDGSSQDVTADVSWTSSDSSIAQVNADGLTTGLTEGRSEIIATLLYEGSSFSDSGRLTVEAPAISIDEIRVQPPTASIITGSTQQYTAEALLSDGRVIDVTRDADWQVTDRTVASITNSGAASGVAEGTSGVTATLQYEGETFSGSAILRVTPPAVVVEELVVSPARTSVLVGSRQPFTARVLLSDGSDQDVSNQVTWSSSESAIASVDSSGLALGVAPGAVDIVASINIEGVVFSDSSRLTVINPAPTVIDLRVEPASSEILVNTKQQFLAFAELNDGSDVDVTGDVSWQSTESSVAQINAAGRATGLRAGSTDIVATLLTEAGNFADAATLTVLPPPVTVLELVIAPVSAEIAIASTQAFNATARLSNGDSLDVTDDVAWSSASPNIAQINSDGVATGLAEGSANIRALLSYGDGESARDNALLAVKAADVLPQTLEVSPQTSTLTPGEQQRFTARATFSDGSQQDVSRDVTWTSSDTDIADVNRSGLSTALEAGNALITATLPSENGPLSDSGELTVEAEPPQLIDLSIFPPVSIIPLGGTQDYRALASFDDGSRTNVTFLGEWSLNQDPPILAPYSGAPLSDAAAVDEFGTALAIAVGSDQLRFEYEGWLALADVTVTEATLVELTISPRNERVAVGTVTDFSAEGVYSDGSRRDISDAVAWGSSNTSVAIISNLSPERGSATSLALGDTTISAALDGLTDSTNLRVNDDPLLRIDVSPADANIPVGSSQPFTAQAIFASGNSQDVSAEASWSSSNTDIATVDESGLARGLAAGSVDIQASFGGSTGLGRLTVEASTVLESITIEPASAALLPLQTLSLTAYGNYSDGSVSDLTRDVEWLSSDRSRVVVSNLDRFGRGLALALLPGVSEITAQLPDNPATSGASTITVLPLPGGIAKLEVNPTLATIVEGDNLAYEAVLVLTGGAEIDVTNFVSWTSDDRSVASIQTGGLAFGESPGSAAITATLASTGFSATAQLTVTADTAVERLVVTPAKAKVVAGKSAAFTATAQLTNGGSVDVTANVEWTTADGEVATITQEGNATGLTAGDTTVQAVLDTGTERFTDTAILTVAPAEVTALFVSPVTASIGVGEIQQYGATVQLSDGTALDVTGDVSWQSSDNTIAQLAPGGIATARAQGEIVVTATLRDANGDFQATATLEVSGLAITEIRINPREADTLVGETTAYAASAILVDGSERDITNDSAWFVGDASIATVSSGRRAGTVTGLAEGDTTVFITYSDGVTDFPCEGIASCEAELRVNNPVTAVRLDVTPTQTEVLIDSTVTFAADLVLSDGQVLDVSDSVSWVSSDTAVAALQAPEGEFIGLSEGVATITAEGNFQGTVLAGSAELTVTPPAITVDRLEVVPATARVFVGDSGRFEAQAYLSNGEVVDVTLESRWASSDTSVGVIEPDTGFGTALSPGQTEVSAEFVYDGISHVGLSTAIVSEAQPDLLEILPENATLAAGDGRQYVATLYYEDGRDEPATENVIWSSSDPNVAVVSNLPSRQGQVDALTTGTATITAEHGSGLTASGRLTVIAPQLLSLEIVPADAETIVGDSLPLVALATFSDESILDVTSASDWSSDNSSVASVQNGGPDTGRVTANAAGAATINAAYEGESATSLISVTANSLVQGWIEPSSNVLEIGDEQDYRAFGEFLDGSTLDITRDVTWLTRDPSVATVGNGNSPASLQPKGRVYALTAGSTDISATFLGQLVDSSPLQVDSAVLPTALIVAPSSGSLLVGEKLGLTATVNFNDGSNKDVSDIALWTSSDDGVAQVSNAPTLEGLVSAQAVGNAVVSAEYEGLSGSATITVAFGSCEGRPSEVIIDADDLIVTEGQQVRFTARGVYDNGCEQDITEANQTVWRSRDKKICDFNSPKGGVATGLKAGVAEIEITHRSTRDTATCTVVPR